MAQSEFLVLKEPTAFEMAHGDGVWKATGQTSDLNKLMNDCMASDACYTNEILIRDCGEVFQGLLKPLLEQILSRGVSQTGSLSSTSIESPHSDIFRFQQALREATGKQDHPGYCRGFGAGITKRCLSHLEGTFMTMGVSHIEDIREDADRAREDVDRARADADRERVRAEIEFERANVVEERANAANTRIDAMEENQRSTMQMFIELRRQFNDLQGRSCSNQNV